MIERTRKGRYRARVYHAGQQVASQTFDRKRDADSWEAAQRLAQVRGTWVSPSVSRVTLGSAITEFNESRRGAVAEHTWATDEGNLRLHMPKPLRSRIVSTITRHDLQAMFVAMLRTHARGTVSRHRNSVSSLFTWAVERGYVDTNPVLSTKLPRGTGQELATLPRPFTSLELASAIERIGKKHPVYAALVEFTALTGLRWGELAALRVGDIVTEPYCAVVVERSKSDGFSLKLPKSRRTRRVPLTPHAIALAARVAGDRPRTELLFTAPRGGPIRGTAFTRSTGWETEGRFHDLRHTAATRWILAGVDVQTVATWMGHSSPATTMNVYSHWLGAESDLSGLARLAGER